MRKNNRLIVARVEMERWEEQEKEMERGSTLDTCRACEQPVWVSPLGHKFVYVDNPDDSEIICVECHIALEIERRRGNENAEPIETRAVPGDKPRPALTRLFTRVVEKVIEQETNQGKDQP